MFKDFEIKENEIIITAGNIQNKAALIGRDKRRLIELEKITRDFFGKDLKIIFGCLDAAVAHGFTDVGDRSFGPNEVG